MLDQQDAVEDGDELDLTLEQGDDLDLDCDVHLRSSLLKNVLPKDMSGKCAIVDGGILDIASTSELRILIQHACPTCCNV